MKNSSIIWPLLILAAGAAWMMSIKDKKKRIGPMVVMGLGAVWAAKVVYDWSGADTIQDRLDNDPSLRVADNSYRPPTGDVPVNLTPQEEQVKQLEEQGLTPLEIAAELGITADDVENTLTSIFSKQESAIAAAVAAEAREAARIAERDRLVAASKAKNDADVAAARVKQTATFANAPPMDGLAAENRDAALAWVTKIMPTGIELRAPFTFGLGATTNFWRQPSASTPQDAAFDLFADWLNSKRPDANTLSSRYYAFLLKNKSGGRVTVNGEDVTRIFDLIESGKG